MTSMQMAALEALERLAQQTDTLQGLTLWPHDDRWWAKASHDCDDNHTNQASGATPTEALAGLWALMREED